ncbi:Winged helix-turn-helix DNA-binding [Halogranum gelatinilyticum]|uniref:Winged helix-turn-helix DNA-binding n=1 Tax=Halogranum gelatinilyticum TaxID=660521 RepID=A0A1H0ABN9_9EURY|nr:helix-turn-helix domain-containing protein [Halogranum gelatinilyticum]SDN30817.1 Winged helix-turn-helix DNA-binding [Halogranum gelatinilyticum]
MSNTQQTHYYDDGGQPTPLPRAVIHKRILDAAETRPGDSVENLAASVSGASVTLVERVLETYGDPGETPAEEEPSADDSPTASSDTAVDPADPTATADPADPAAEAERPPFAVTDGTANRSEAEMVTATGGPDAGATTAHAERSPDSTERVEETTADRNIDARDDPAADEWFDGLTTQQQETLAAVVEHPHATQRDLADILGVSCATINRRVNSIENFDWEDRRVFITTMLDADADTADTDKPTDRTPDVFAAAQSEPTADADTDVDRRLSALERRVDEECGGKSVFDDPELAHKILHACMNSDRISEAEELRIVEEALCGRSSSTDQ